MARSESLGRGFFRNLFSSLFGSKDPEAEKRRRLRAIAKSLSKSHYHFYKAGSNEVLPAFAKLIYEIYKAVTPVQVLFQNVQNQNAFKHFVIEYSLSDNQRRIEEELTEEAILAKSKTIPVNQLVQHVKESIDVFEGEFGTDRINTAEQLYKTLLAFKDFCMYDFYFMLKKFDSTLVEKQFAGNPRFDKINGEYIADDLKDFITVAWNVTGDTDWAPLMKMFREIKGVEPVSPGVWKKIVAKLQAIRQSEVFEMMVQLITENPDYMPVIADTTATLVEPFLDKFKLETTAALHKLESAEKNSKVNDILIKLFSTTVILYLKNYTEQNSSNLVKKHLRGYLYYEPLNYLKGFLLEFVKKDIREYSELILIRGKWASAPLSSPMSNAYNDLLAASEAISAFDQNFAEDGAAGIKIKTLLPRIQHDADSAGVINRIVTDANEQAKSFIVDSTRNLITIGKTVKSLIEDEMKKSPEMIINWKEIEHFADHPPKELGIEVYKKIYLFATLMQTCMSGGD
ncbi:MAG TPA: hypothetical protein DCL73_08375 [Treponema sp.]|nr:hypothetical protein [Treponema sp.]